MFPLCYSEHILKYTSFLLPLWYDGLSWCYSGTRLVWPVQALTSDVQTHKAEFHLTAFTHYAFTKLCVMLYKQTTAGTGAYGGAAFDLLHFLEDDVRAAFQYVQWALAVDVVTVIRARSWTFPFSQTLPAESIISSFASGTNCALHIQIVGLLSRHAIFAPGTL